MKILLVEDDSATRALLEKALSDCYMVAVAEDGRSALTLVEQDTYDLLLLDVGLPEINGIDICKRLRAQGYQTPILFLTARDRANDRVLGLDAGADDYVVKPFHVPELLARIRALLRRGQSATVSTVTWENLHLDRATNEIRYREQLLRLTPKEYSILELLLLNPQRIFSRSTIINRLWELGAPPTESAISSHIKAIRQKLKAAGANQDLVETVYGFGYRLRALDTAIDTSCSAASPTPPEAEKEVAAEAEIVMAELWERFKDSFSSQIDGLEEVVVQLQEGKLTPELRQEAKQTVHKLIGSLGVYGLSEGTVLATQIEDLLDADILLESLEIQQMAQWVVTLRQQVNQKAAAMNAYVPSISTVSRVLVVDPDQILVERLQAAAKARSLQVITAFDLVAAQHILERSLPDVILLNFAAAFDQDDLSNLEGLTEQYPQIPVLVLTGQDNLETRLTFSCLGVRHVLHHSVSPEQVFEAIDRVLSKPLRSDISVLIVDDDELVLAFLSILLAPWGIAVTTLSDPQRFWNVLVETAPDLLLLDFEMPQINGLELCQVVRQDLYWGDLPILVVTAHTDADSLQQAFAAGADDFITKPVLGPELVARVLSRIERTRFRRSLEHSDMHGKEHS